MIYLLKKSKSLVLLLLILALSFGAWYMFTNKNSNKIPDKADLVLNIMSMTRGI